MVRVQVSATRLRPSEHFLRRLHARFPELRITESRLLRELLEAEWYSAGESGPIYYVPVRTPHRVAIFVVALELSTLVLLTVYEPSPGWARRLDGLHGVVGALVATSAGTRTPPRPYMGAKK